MTAQGAGSEHDRRPDFVDWMNAWMSGYIAHRDGLTEDDPEALIRACKDEFHMSGTELARRVDEGTLTDADRAKIAEFRRHA